MLQYIVFSDNEKNFTFSTFISYLVLFMGIFLHFRSNLPEREFNCRHFGYQANSLAQKLSALRTLKEKLSDPIFHILKYLGVLGENFVEGAWRWN